MVGITRREFIVGAAGAAGTLAVSGNARVGAWPRPVPRPLPPPGQSEIDHIVVLMMENRSFDHYLGWLPGADGKQAGLTYRDRAGRAHPTHHLTDFQNCAHPDPDHSYDGGRIQLDGGKCDGFLRSGENDSFAIGFYTQSDLALYSKAVPRWTTFDRYFCSFMGPTFPNRLY